MAPKSKSKKAEVKPAKRSSGELSNEDLDKVTGGSGDVGDKGDKGRIVAKRLDDKDDRAVKIVKEITFVKKS